MAVKKKIIIIIIINERGRFACQAYIEHALIIITTIIKTLMIVISI